MADTVPTETVTPEPLSNNGQPVAPVAGNANDPAEVERLRKEAEQAKMRAQQLANQLEERRKADEAARQKQLEEKEEFRTLYEQTQAKLAEIEANQAAQERREQLSQATNEMFREYPEAVVDLARTAGLGLADDSEEAKATLKGKLDEIQGKLGTAVRVTPNNPAQMAPTETDIRSLTARDPQTGASPMALAAARGDDSLTYKYIRELPAIKRMREISKGA